MQSPPTPPDHTKDNAAFAKAEFERRQAEALKYNTAVDQYNQRLKGYGQQLNSLRTGTITNPGTTGQQQSTRPGFRNLTIADDEYFNYYDTQFGNLANRLSGNEFRLKTPQWTSMVQAPSGEMVEVGIPQLRNVNTSYRDNLLSTVQGFYGDLDTLRAERKAEEERINAFRTSLNSNLARASSTAAGLKFSDVDAIRALQSELSDYAPQKAGFRSAILSEYAPNLWTRADAQYNSINSRLNSLLGQYDTENSRISDYGSGLDTFYDDISSRFAGLSMANPTDLEALKREIDARQLAADRFTSNIDYNFNPQLGRIQSLEDQLDLMMSDREAELARIREAQNTALSGTQNLLGQIQSSDYYNSGQLTQLESMIRAARGDMSNFTSELPYDFSSAQGYLSDAESALAALRSSRSSALGGIDSGIDTLFAGLDSINPWDETALNSALSRVQDYSSDLSPYTGTDIAPIRSDITAAERAIRDRLTSLYGTRSSIESDAASLLAALQSRSYGSDADVEAALSELSGLQTRADQYDATSSFDEIASINDFLTSQRDRLAEDAATVAARDQGGPGGAFGQLLNLGYNVPISAEQYQAFLSSMARNRDNSWWAPSRSRPSSYSSVIRI